MRERLTADEMQRWTAWKRAGDAVWAEVVRSITDATGLSSADFSVLTRVVEADAPPRQQVLADELSWSRSRLSRQLSRMADRGLVQRVGTRVSTTVEVTTEGRALVVRARAAHAVAVRRALLAVAPVDELDFWRVVDVLASSEPRDLR